MLVPTYYIHKAIRGLIAFCILHFAFLVSFLCLACPCSRLVSSARLSNFISLAEVTISVCTVHLIKVDRLKSVTVYYTNWKKILFIYSPGSYTHSLVLLLTRRLASLVSSLSSLINLFYSFLFHHSLDTFIPTTFVIRMCCSQPSQLGRSLLTDRPTRHGPTVDRYVQYKTLCNMERMRGGWTVVSSKQQSFGTTDGTKEPLASTNLHFCKRPRACRIAIRDRPRPSHWLSTSPNLDHPSPSTSYIIKITKTKKQPEPSQGKVFRSRLQCKQPVTRPPEKCSPPASMQ